MVNKNNRDSWTKIHREKAGHRVMARSVEHLQELVRKLLLRSIQFTLIHFQINETQTPPPQAPKGRKSKLKPALKRKHEYIGVPSHITGGYVYLLYHWLPG